MGIRITDLASTSVVGLTDTLVLVQGGNTKKCDVSQVKTLSASELVTGTLGVARLPVVPVSLGGTGAVNATSALAALGAQPALTSDAPASLAQGGTGATTAVAALNALGGITSDAVPSLVTAQLSAYALTSQLSLFQNSAQVQALTTAQLSAITLTAGTGLTGGGSLDQSRTIALETSGVSAGTFGSSTQIPVLTVDDKGRVTSVQNVTPLPGNNASDLTTGTLDPNRLATTAVAAGTYGSNALVGQFIVDSKGRITNAANIPISGSAGGTVVSVGATSSTLAISNSPVTYSGALQLELSTTGVPAITAGSSTQSAVITVDAYGRITNLETQAIAALFPTGVTAGSYGSQNSVGKFTVDVNGVMTGATEQVLSIAASQVLAGLTSAQVTGISAAQVSSGITSAQINSLSAAQVGAGITSAQVSGISAAQVAAGITSAQVNSLSASQIGSGLTSAQVVGLSAAQISTGLTSAQITGLSAAQIGAGLTSAQITGLSAGQISGLAASATTDTTNAANISSGLLNVTRLPFSGVVATNYGSATTVPVISVDAYGRITSATNAAVTQLTDASQITTGTLNVNRLATSGVAAGSFGSSTQIAALTVDQFGRITAASSQPASVTIANFGFVRETINISANAANASGIQFDALSQGVLYYTSSATAAWPFNVRGNSGTTLNASMNIGQSVTIVFLNTTGPTGFGLTSNANFTIDGIGSIANRTLRWVNNANPVATSNGIDAWSFVIMKTADNVFSVLGSVSSWGAAAT